MGQHRTKNEILAGRWWAGVEAAKELIRARIMPPTADPLSDAWEAARSDARQLAEDLDSISARITNTPTADET